MKTILLITLLSFISTSSFSQGTKDLYKILVDPQDTTVIAYVLWKKKNSVPARDEMTFHFDSIFEGHYEIKTSMLTPQTEHLIQLETYQDYLYYMNSSEINRFFNETPDIIYTIYTHGLPRYSDDELNIKGMKYGVRWKNMGCLVDGSYSHHNNRVSAILLKRNGINWVTNFWDEIEQK